MGDLVTDWLTHWLTHSLTHSLTYITSRASCDAKNQITRKTKRKGRKNIFSHFDIFPFLRRILRTACKYLAFQIVLWNKQYKLPNCGVFDTLNTRDIFICNCSKYSFNRFMTILVNSALHLYVKLSFLSFSFLLEIAYEKKSKILISVTFCNLRVTIVIIKELEWCCDQWSLITIIIILLIIEVVWC